MLSVELHSQSTDTLCTISIYVLKALLRIHAINTHVPPVASLFSFRSLWVTQMPTGLFSSTFWQDGDEPAQPDRGSRVFHDWSSVGRGTAACRDSGSNHRPSSLGMFLVSQHNLKVPDLDAGKRNAQDPDTLLYKPKEAVLLNRVSSALRTLPCVRTELPLSSHPCFTLTNSILISDSFYLPKPTFYFRLTF